MRSRQLEVALTVFVEEAAVALQELLAGGAEVPIEIVAQSSRRGQAPLYSYRSLMWRFVREHAESLERLATHGPAVSQLAQFGGLERYLRSRELAEVPADGEGQARVALGLLLEDVFAEQTAFKLRRERLRGALELLDGTRTRESPSRVTIIATLQGVALSASELTLAAGLAIVHPKSVHGLPEDILGEEAGAGDRLLVVYSGEQAGRSSTIAEGRAILRELLRALRLFGDGRVSLGAIGWARTEGGRWRAIALGCGGRPHGRLLITPEQEDQLRAFCEIVSRRAPTANALAWALERFELGCERPAPVQALSDYLLALRALFHGPEQSAPSPASEVLLARRLSVICAAPADREQLAGRTLQAIALERSVALDGGLTDVRQEGLVRDLGEQVRRLLRDVICGRLDSDLVQLADGMLAASEADVNHDQGLQAPAPVTPESTPTSLSRARTTRRSARSDEEETVVLRRAARKASAASR